MKKILLAGVMIILVAAAILNGSAAYYKPAKIVANQNGLVTVEDEAGCLWQYYEDGPTEEGGEVLLVMKGDEIINIK